LEEAWSDWAEEKVRRTCAHGRTVEGEEASRKTKLAGDARGVMTRCTEDMVAVVSHELLAREGRGVVNFHGGEVISDGEAGRLGLQWRDSEYQPT
jgi:phage head maturation protease